MRRLGTRVRNALLIVYFGIAIIVTAFYSWTGGADDRRRETGLLGWFTTGQAGVGTQGLLWPLLLVNHQPKTVSLKVELIRVFPAIKAAGLYNRRMVEFIQHGGTPSLDQARELMSIRTVVAGVQPINAKLLDTLYPEFGTMLQTKCFAAIMGFLDPAVTDRKASTERCNRLINEWNEWYNPRADEIAKRLLVVVQS
jgi:hypothetical protein